ncbi:MAG: hypothetical protein AAFQ12_00845 [Pseudomonadota bacterium]
MKTQIGMVALGLAVAACGGEPDIADPYADLAEDSILVRFEANPEIEDGMCNPNVHYAMRTTEEAIFLNVNYEVVDQNLSGSGFAIINAEQSGIAKATSELSMFDPYPLPCSELTVRAMDLTCRLEDENDGETCPNPVFEGTEMFASFRGLPTY